MRNVFGRVGASKGGKAKMYRSGDEHQHGYESESGALGCEAAAAPFRGRESEQPEDYYWPHDGAGEHVDPETKPSIRYLAGGRDPAAPRRENGVSPRGPPPATAKTALAASFPAPEESVGGGGGGGGQGSSGGGSQGGGGGGDDSINPRGVGQRGGVHHEYSHTSGGGADHDRPYRGRGKRLFQVGRGGKRVAAEEAAGRCRSSGFGRSKATSDITTTTTTTSSGSSDHDTLAKRLSAMKSLEVDHTASSAPPIPAAAAAAAGKGGVKPANPPQPLWRHDGADDAVVWSCSSPGSVGDCLPIAFAGDSGMGASSPPVAAVGKEGLQPANPPQPRRRCDGADDAVVWSCPTPGSVGDCLPITFGGSMFGPGPIPGSVDDVLSIESAGDSGAGASLPPVAAAGGGGGKGGLQHADPPRPRRRRDGADGAVFWSHSTPGSVNDNLPIASAGGSVIGPRANPGSALGGIDLGGIPISFAGDIVSFVPPPAPRGLGRRVSSRGNPCQHPGCTKGASFCHGGGRRKGVVCAEHKRDGMVRVFSTRVCAEGACLTAPSYGLRGEKAVVCSKHKAPGMVNVVSPRCQHAEGCASCASYGRPGDWRPLFCSRHAQDGMSNVVSRKCLGAGCATNPSYGNPGDRRPSFCASHHLPGMSNIVSRRCAAEACAKAPSFGREGDRRATFCKKHKQEGMVNMAYARNSRNAE